jgi:drug/metabolite transporter (DMT)-like permease
VHILGATKMGGLMALVPVFASVLAVPIFGEQWTLGLTIALVLILTGTIFGNIRFAKWRQHLLCRAAMKS